MGGGSAAGKARESPNLLRSVWNFCMLFLLSLLCSMHIHMCCLQVVFLQVYMLSLVLTGQLAM